MRGFEPYGFETWVSKTNEIAIDQLSLLAQVLGFIRIGDGLVGSVLG